MTHETNAEAQRGQLVGEVYAANADLHELAERMGLTLTQLAELAADEGFVRTVGSLCHLADLRGRLIVSRYRVHAAAKLVALSGQDDSAEIARKASVDLLKLDPTPGAASAPRDRAADDEDADPPADPEQLLDVLRAIGGAAGATNAKGGAR